MWRPETYLKHWSTLFTPRIDSSSLSGNKITSSAYYRYVSSMLQPRNLMPLKIFFTFATVNSFDRTSPNKLKIRGNSGSPYLKPLDGLNSSVGFPLSRNEFFADSNKDLIHMIHLSSKFILCRTRKMKSQLIVSNALAKSNYSFTFPRLQFHINLQD